MGFPMGDSTLLRLLEQLHRSRVLVLGDVMLDRFVYGAVERISPEAPVPVLTVERRAAMPGGAANVARNVATLGGHAVLIGIVGEDEAAAELKAQLASLPTVRAELLAEPARPTTLKTRHIAAGQQILRSDVESCQPLSAASAQAILARVEAALPDVDIVILSDYAKGLLSPELTAQVIAAARAAARPVVVDPKTPRFAKYRGATLLTPNRQELQAACGLECTDDASVAQGARVVLEQGVCDTIVVTRGREGMSIVRADGGAPVHLKTTALEVFDVSGAGDTAVATLALALAHEAPWIDAVRLANLAAGIVVAKPGTATVSTGEIVAHLDEADDGYAAAGKHYTLESVALRVARWREQGLRIAFTNGCFDLLHPGHVSLLHQARASADRLVVGLNSDLSVRRLKGPGRPVQGEAARAAVLASLRAVDAVVIFAEDTPLDLIRSLEPDVLVKGADYSMDTVVGADLVRARGGRVVLAELLPAHSTTSTIERIAAGATTGT
jgi:D-beta-D-heptose 7-phosphate kinase/D-beta-D-heptose 1-phosphate adenosyltransferase